MMLVGNSNFSISHENIYSPQWTQLQCHSPGSAPIDCSLLKVALDFAHASNPEYILVRIPVDLNPEGVKILENELGAKSIMDFVVMASGEAPSKCLSEVFSTRKCSSHVTSQRE